MFSAMEHNVAIYNLLLSIFLDSIETGISVH